MLANLAKNQQSRMHVEDREWLHVKWNIHATL